MAGFFLSGNHRAHSKFKAVNNGLIASGYIVFRAYTYDKEKKYNPDIYSWTLPITPQFFTECEYTQLRQLKVSSSFCPDKSIDKWGHVRIGVIEVSEQLCILFRQVNVFVVIQTENDEMFMTGSANAMELIHAAMLRSKEGRPELVYLATAMPSCILVDEFFDISIPLPLDIREALEQLESIVSIA